MPLVRRSPCKVNFVLDVLGRRPDGFHELETLFYPVPLHDELTFDLGPTGIKLTCNHPDLPVDATNLVHRAAAKFLNSARLETGVRIHLDKRLPLAAGIGAGSANAAITLLALNDLFDRPLADGQLDVLAAELGSDVNFFLQPNPALAFGRGERITPLAPFAALNGHALLLFHPGFGVATPWAFRELARLPAKQNSRSGRAQDVANRFLEGDVQGGAAALYNALEGPVLRKHPVLTLYQEFLREQGALGTLMCGSGSTTFGLFAHPETAQAAVPGFHREFGEAGWLQVVPL